MSQLNSEDFLKHAAVLGMDLYDPDYLRQSVTREIDNMHSHTTHIKNGPGREVSSTSNTDTQQVVA